MRKRLECLGIIVVMGLVAYAFLSLLVSCRPANSDVVEFRDSYGTARKFDVNPFTYKGHQYLRFASTTSHGMAIVHDPDCVKCKL
jgi:hypothetical protein